MTTTTSLDRITHPHQVNPGDVVLLHATTSSEHIDGLQFVFAPCRVIEHRQNTLARQDTHIPVLDQFGRFDWIDPTVDETYLLATAAEL